MHNAHTCMAAYYDNIVLQTCCRPRTADDDDVAARVSTCNNYCTGFMMDSGEGEVRSDRLGP